MGQEAGKKWAAAAHSQPTIPKSDRLLSCTMLRQRCRVRPSLLCAYRRDWKFRMAAAATKP
ncbi:hypothetical protein [Extensimonas vulgaris]|uniref:hypothetical protein n=1 Tax=Extensimonas vulgaris TaxID=1031594 RepID=UPI0011C04215|nr:hypothetical protein [Extensimonas vulgaris]TXD14574.1 hypothetical protein FUT63_09445 [Extensimonas vulgaris]